MIHPPLSRNRRPPWSGCLLAIACVAAAFALQSLLWGLLPASPFLLFYPAIFLAAWLGGLGCGLLATALSAIVTNRFFLPPYGSFSLGTGELISELLFVLMGIGITAFTDRQERLKAKSDAQRQVYNALLDATEDHVFVYDREHRFIYLNRATREAVRAALIAAGKDPDQPIVGKTNRELGYGEELYSGFEKRLEEAFTGKTVKEELLQPSPTGSRIFEYVLTPLFNEKRQIVAVSGFTRDVHDRKIESERMDLALKAAQIGVFEIDFASPRIQWSPRQYKIFGIDPNTQPLTYEVFFNAVHPEDRPAVEKEFKDSVAEHRDFDLRFRVRKKDSSDRWVRGRARTVYDRHGKPLRMIGTNVDISDSVNAQELTRESATRFRALAESMPQIVWATDANGKPDYYNNQWFDFLGISPSGPAPVDLVPYIHPDDQEKAALAWQDAFAYKKRLQLELRLRRMDGLYFWFLSRAVPIFDTEGKLTRWYGTLTNIDEVKKAQEGLEKAVQSREETLAIVSHDLRNPLGSILMNVGIIRRRFPQVETLAREHLNKIQRASERMNNMIEDLLNLAKLEAGTFSLSKHEACSCEIINEAVDLVAPLAEEKSIRIETWGVDPDLEMSCDRGQLLRVFSNLIGNAIKFTPEKGLIQIRAEDIGEEIRFSVRDTGPGIAEHHIPHVFDRYWQVNRTRHLGTGLGLSIAKGLVEAHGGHIWVESRFGHGATFYFTILKAGIRKMSA